MPAFYGLNPKAIVLLFHPLPLVRPQHTQHRGKLAQVLQRMGGAGFAGGTAQVDIEQVFPKGTRLRTGFDLAQIDIPQGKNAQRLEQRARDVIQRKDDRSLRPRPGVLRQIWRSPENAYSWRRHLRCLLPGFACRTARRHGVKRWQPGCAHRFL